MLYRTKSQFEKIFMKATPKSIISLMTIIIVLISYSCQKDNIEGELTNDPEFIESLYTNASDTVTIDNQDLILETEIYRDFSRVVLFMIKIID